MPVTVLSINDVNNIVSGHFIKIFGNVVEHYPAAAVGILKKRPFKDALDISNAINTFLDGLSAAEKINVLQLYPDLVAKLTDLSLYILNLYKYERISGLDQLTIADKGKLSGLNKRYRDKFGFPFIFFGKENKASMIFSEMESRIENNVEDEVQVALAEVKKIAKLRIHEILQR